MGWSSSPVDKKQGTPCDSPSQDTQQKGKHISLRALKKVKIVKENKTVGMHHHIYGKKQNPST